MSAGMSARSMGRGAGGSCMTAIPISAAVEPVNGSLPVKSSKKMTPSAQMSERLSMCLELRHCSGDA